MERVIPASTAERCGALCVGDRLLAIDDVTIPSHCAAEAQRMLRSATRLQILPAHASLRSPSRSTTREIAQSPQLGKLIFLNMRFVVGSVKFPTNLQFFTAGERSLISSKPKIRKANFFILKKIIIVKCFINHYPQQISQ